MSHGRSKTNTYIHIGACIFALGFFVLTRLKAKALITAEYMIPMRIRIAGPYTYILLY